MKEAIEDLVTGGGNLRCGVGHHRVATYRPVGRSAPESSCVVTTRFAANRQNWRYDPAATSAGRSRSAGTIYTRHGQVLPTQVWA